MRIERAVDAVSVFLYTVAYGHFRIIRAAFRAAVATYHLGTEEILRRMRNGHLALLLVLLLPASAAASEGWPTVSQFLLMNARQQEQYVHGFMWGAAYAMTKADVGLQGCDGADKTPSMIIAEIQGFAITAPPQLKTRSVNRLMGDLLFTGCRFERASF